MYSNVRYNRFLSTLSLCLPSSPVSPGVSRCSQLTLPFNSCRVFNKNITSEHFHSSYTKSPVCILTCTMHSVDKCVNLSINALKHINNSLVECSCIERVCSYRGWQVIASQFQFRILLTNVSITFCVILLLIVSFNNDSLTSHSFIERTLVTFHVCVTISDCLRALLVDDVETGQMIVITVCFLIIL